MSTGQSDNPFMPSAEIAPTAGSNSVAGNEQTLLLLRQTRPWVIAMGILGIIFGVLVALGGIGMAFVGAAAEGGPMEMGMFAGMAVMYVLLGVLYFFPGLYLISYGRRIGAYMAQPSHENLNAALKSQKSFWKFVGMMVLVIFVLYVAAIVVVMLVGFAGVPN